MEGQTNIETIDLSSHRWDGSSDWYREMSEKYGQDKALQMCEYMEKIANHLKVGAYIDIPKLVTNPEKIDLAVKIACVIVVTAQMSKKGPMFQMNNTYTQLKRIA